MQHPSGYPVTPCVLKTSRSDHPHSERWQAIKSGAFEHHDGALSQLLMVLSSTASQFRDNW